MLNVNKLYETLTLRVYALGVKRQFLAQVTEPQAFVNASYPIHLFGLRRGLARVNEI
jgi:hypothetical protein